MGDEEQRAYWMPLIDNHKILGCYAQTELGHGSNVAQLETTATLDLQTDEFIIHSPTPTSTKYWPGDLGRFSTHACVFARAIVGDKDYGVNAFIVQMRDINTYKHLKGVTSGDIGAKIGYSYKDNGWAAFDQVRIPRRNMLMGVAAISKTGEFEVLKDLRVLYSTMVLIRTTIVCNVPVASLSSLRIALRYGAVRR
jgi:acyl-CoA oxidase